MSMSGEHAAVIGGKLFGHMTTTHKPAQAPRPRPSLLARLRYRLDNALARGPIVVIGYLGLVFLGVIFVVAVVAALARLSMGDGGSTTFPETFWQAMLRTLDPGTFSGDSGWPTRFVALVVTVTGIFLGGALIGLLANSVDQKVEELRRGRNPVLEAGHTLILGWSPQVARIIGELIVANESEKRATIVVLSREDKTVVEDVLRTAVPDTRTTRLVCRTGNPANPDDLERAAIAGARSIIVVRGDDGDAGVVKAVLAIRALDPQLARRHVVAELTEADNTRIIKAVTYGRVLTVSSDHVVAKVTAQACFQGGMAAVFTELLDFDGDELYFATVPDLAGHTYRDGLLAFENCSLLGRLTADGNVELNPPTDSVFGPGDQVIVVAEDDSTVAFTGFRAVDPPPPAVSERARPAPVRIAMVGWSGFGAMVLKELDEFLPVGSSVEVVVDKDLADPEPMKALTMEHAALTVRVGDGGPDHLRSLGEGAHPDQVVVLGYRDSLSVDDADARTLLTLLTLRTMWPAEAADHVRIVAELLDQQNLALADPVGVDDLIVSSALSSLLMAQLSEHAHLGAVFDDLFDAAGAVLEMRPAPELVKEEAMPFAAVVAAGAAAGASVIGYRIGATGSVVVNPAKSDAVTLGADDQIVLVATNDA
jgi:ion channel POLLUX/CASTOR